MTEQHYGKDDDCTRNEPGGDSASNNWFVNTGHKN